jgi:ArsR family transcriptional regulator, arsenate/arsenite/antimonite-responsive transcriptional repressor
MNISDRKLIIIKTLSNCDGISNPEDHYQQLLQIKEHMSNSPERTRFCEILEALGNDDRLLILDALAAKDRCVCELEAILDKAQSSVSHHLKLLEDAGLIRGWKKGKFTHYSLVKRQFIDFKAMMSEWLGKIDNWFEELPQKR